MSQQSIFVPVGYTLTLTAPSDSAGSYWVLGNPGDQPGAPSSLSAGANVVLGPFDSPKNYMWQSNNSDFTAARALAVVGNDPAVAGVYAPLASPTFTGTVTLPIVSMTKVNGTEAAGAVTASGNAGIITTSSLTTAAGTTFDITWTNTRIAATSVVQLTHVGGTNTKFISLKVVPGSGSAVLTIQNDDLLAALNGTVLIAYMVV